MTTSAENKLRLSVLLAATIVFIATSGVKSVCAGVAAEAKRIPLGHGAEVTSILFSPDGKILITGSRDQTVKLWNAETGDLLRTLSGHSGEQNSISLSPDGRMLGVSGADAVDLYDTTTWKVVHSLAASQIAGPLSFSPDSKFLITKSVAERGNLRLWDVQTGKPLWASPAHKVDVRAIAFSPDGKAIASIGIDSSLKLWDAHTGTFVKNLTGFKYNLEDVTFSPDGKTVAGADTYQIFFWNTQTGELEQHIQADERATNFAPPVKSIIYSHDGTTLAISSNDDNFTLLDVAGGKPKYHLRQNSRPYAAAFSPDDKTIATACEPKAIYVWNLETSELRLKIGNESQSYAVALSPNGKEVASDGGFFDTTLRVWNAETGKLARTITGHDTALSQLVFSPDGKLIVGAQHGNTLYVWDFNSGELIQSISVTKLADISSIRFSPDGKFLIVATNYEDGRIRLFDTQTWQVKRSVLASRTTEEVDPDTKKKVLVPLGVICTQLSPDGNALAAVVDQGQTLKVWNTRTWAVARAVPFKASEMFHCAISSNQRLVITNYNDSENPRFGLLDVWDGVRGVLSHTLSERDVNPLGFLPGDRMFLVAEKNGSLSLRDSLTGKPTIVFKGHLGDVSSAAFSRDGATLLTGGADGTVRLWNVNTGEMIRMFVLED